MPFTQSIRKSRLPSLDSTDRGSLSLPACLRDRCQRRGRTGAGCPCPAQLAPRSLARSGAQAWRRAGARPSCTRPALHLAQAVSSRAAAVNVAKANLTWSDCRNVTAASPLTRRAATGSTGPGQKHKGRVGPPHPEARPDRGRGSGDTSPGRLQSREAVYLPGALPSES
jgi:hypothetical protein